MPIVAKEKDAFLSAIDAWAKARAASDPAWLAALRSEAAARFAALEFPTTRDEEWKYTSIAPLLKNAYRQETEPPLEAITPQSLAPYLVSEAQGRLLVFVNGRYSRELSDLTQLPAGVVASNFSDLPEAQVSRLRDHLGRYADPSNQVFTALNTSLIGDGAFVFFAAGRVIEEPIQLLFISASPQENQREGQAEAKGMSHPRVLIIADRGAMASVLESHISASDDVFLTNAVTEVYVSEGAMLDHYRLQAESERAFHIATTEVRQERESGYRSCAISLGAEISRHDLSVALMDEYTETWIDGLYVATGRQHVDNHTTLDHRKHHGTSHQLYKGILDDRARAVFNGKIFVREGALLVDARQLNKNLLLSNEATVNTKPQLEIFADDVKCAHGATVGQLEEDEIFYLASRGISPERARALLTYGFAEDVISRIRLDSARAKLDRLVLDKLHQNLEVN